MERVNKRVASRNPVGPGHSAIWLLHPATAGLPLERDG